MDRWKAEQGRGREKRKIRREKIRRERVRRKKMQMREKVGKSRNTMFFQWFEAPEGRKVGSLKRVRSQLARWEMKNCTPLWREAHFEVKMYKAHQVRTTFGSWDVEKVHAVVARSTFRSQNVQSTSAPDHFWKLWYFEKVHAVVARRTFRSKHFQNTRGSDHFWRFRCRFTSIHYTTGHYTTLHSSTLHYTTLHSSTLHYTKLHYTILHYSEWHCNTDRQVDS